MVTMEMVYKILKEYQPHLFFSHLHDSYTDISFLTPTDEIKENTLYITDAETLTLAADRLIHTSLIVLGEKKLQPKVLEKLNHFRCTVLVCHSRVSMLKIFNEIKNLFVKEINFLQQIRLLHNRMLESQSVQEILSIGEQIVGNPIVLIDESFKIIDFSKGKQVTDAVWANNIKNGYCSYEFIMEVTNNKAVKDAPMNEEPFLVTCRQSGILKLASKVFVQKKLRGYIIILVCYQNLSDEQMKLIPEISKIIGYQLSSHSINSYHLLEEKLLLDILENRIGTKKELEDRIKASRIKFGENFYLLLMKGKSSLSKKQKNATIQSQLSRLFPESKQLIYKDQLLVLISFRDLRNWNESIKISLLDFLKENSLKGIKSDNFSDIGTLAFVHAQLVKSMQLAELLGKDESFIDFSTLKFEHLLNEFPEKEHLLSYCHPAVLQLYKYDKQNGTDLYQSLFAFLYHNKNLQDASEALYVHRNTLKNRLKKIHDLTGIDIAATTGEITFQLAYSNKILTYLLHVGEFENIVK